MFLSDWKNNIAVDPIKRPIYTDLRKIKNKEQSLAASYCLAQECDATMLHVYSVA
jgi:hypothetical protein